MSRALWIALSALKWRGCGFVDRHAGALGEGAAVLLEGSRADVAALPGIKAAQVDRLMAARAGLCADAHEREAARCGLAIVTPADDAWPHALRGVADAPLALYHAGPLPERDAPVVAMVGTRGATWYGLDVARQMARELAAAGVVVASGLAQGVDGAAHRGALDAPGGRTVAVLAAGAHQAYPPGHRALYDEIRARGTVMSETPPGVALARHLFPLRNRIVSGLARAVVVVEAPIGSGALITARDAVEQGREVLIVPGPVTSATCAGSNAWIRDGNGRVVTSARDVLEVLGMQALDPVGEPDTGEGGVKGRLVAMLAAGPLHVDAIMAQLGVPPGRVHRLLLELLGAGVVGRLPGNRWGRTRGPARLAETITPLDSYHHYIGIAEGGLPAAGSEASESAVRDCL